MIQKKLTLYRGRRTSVHSTSGPQTLAEFGWEEAVH